MSDDTPGAGEPIEITSCDDVLSHVFEFLDHETDDEPRALIPEHLEDCSGGLREFGIEEELQALVRCRCGGDTPPSGLRERIKIQLTTVSFEEDGTQVSVERITAERSEDRPASICPRNARAPRPASAGRGALRRGPVPGPGPPQGPAASVRAVESRGSFYEGWGGRGPRSGVGPLAVVGLVPLAGATLASTLGHRCPPLAVPVGLQTLVLAGRDAGARIVRDIAGTAKLTPQASHGAVRPRAGRGNAGGDTRATAGDRQRAGRRSRARSLRGRVGVHPARRQGRGGLLGGRALRAACPAGR